MDAYEKSLSYLSLREHTAKEIEGKLTSKGYSRKEAEDAISRLLKEGYISEERFAEAYIRSRLRKNAEGRALLSMRLREKGTPSSVAEKYLDEAWEEKMYLPSLVKEYKSLSDKKGEEKALQRLYAKGFSRGEINEAREEILTSS